MKELTDLGWSEFFENQINEHNDEKLRPGRVANVQKTSVILLTADGEISARFSGALSYDMANQNDHIAVGDFVLYSAQPEADQAMIQVILSRENVISRQAAGSRNTRRERVGRRQVMAANVTAVFIVCGLDRDYNLRRIERYLSLAYNCDANPVILLNKADLCANPEIKFLEVEDIAMGAPVVLMNARNENDVNSLYQYITPGDTAVFLGSSGVGKSTLINGLLGFDRQKTAAVSAQVGKGRHTTTSRELFLLSKGGLVIDTPGMRELQLSESEDGLKAAFEEIATLATSCRFSDCTHQVEPGCAVLSAIESGDIDRERLDSYQKLKKENAFYAERQYKDASKIEKDKWRQIKIETRRFKKRYK